MFTGNCSGRTIDRGQPRTLGVTRNRLSLDPWAMMIEPYLALGQRLGMGTNSLDALQRRSLGEQVVADRNRHLAADHESGLLQQIKRAIDSAFGRIFNRRNAKITGIDLLERLLRHAKHFEFTELTLDILRVLRLQYSTVDGDISKYEDIKKQYLEYEKIWQMESKAEFFYSELMAQYTNSKSTKEEVTQQAEEFYAELKPFMAVCSSFKLHLFGAGKYMVRQH